MQGSCCAVCKLPKEQCPAALYNSLQIKNQSQNIYHPSLPRADGRHNLLGLFFCHCQIKACLCLQFLTCCLLSMGHAAETVGIAANCFAITLQIHRTGEVQSDAEISWHLRLLGAAGMVVGILLAGWRLIPVSGVLLHRSCPCCCSQQAFEPARASCVTQQKFCLLG